MDDLSAIIEQIHHRRHPSPIEWMLNFDRKMKELGHSNWGYFKGAENLTISVVLEAVTKSEFFGLVNDIPLKNFVFEFLKK